MILLVSTITLLLILTRTYFPTYKKQINISIVILSIWLIVGITLKLFFQDEPKRKYTDVEMAQNLIKEDPEFKKAKMKILDDGSVRITTKRRKRLKLKDGVLTSVR
jgi:hypothetical protein